MNTGEIQELKERMASLDGKRRKNLWKQAAERRASAQRGDSPQARWTIEQWALKLLRDESPAAVEADAPEGVVEWVGRELCRVRREGKTLRCRLSDEVAKRQQTALAPGDRVRLDRLETDSPRVTEVRPRRTSLCRRDPHIGARERAIVANVDLVVVVLSVVSPPLHPRLLDRLLAAIRRGGAEALVAVNKIDLLEDSEGRRRELSGLRPYEELGVPVLPVSVQTGEGIAEVRRRLAGRTCAFVGHSGVGKSSLMNAILGTQDAVGEVSDASGRGRHTTTASRLVEGPDGTVVIDTPGVREFGVHFDSLDEVQEAFPEFEALAPRCERRGCTHLREPGCAVRGAVADGRIHRARYASYVRLAEELGSVAGKPPETDAGFACLHCGFRVSGEGAGSRHRNHCPNCLHSRHLDDVPGDRAAACGGLMEPVAVWVRRGGEWALIHRCRECGRFGSNRIAADDNEALLLSLSVRPLARPPFPLDRLDVV